jgi:hypothetical protein
MRVILSCRNTNRRFRSRTGAWGIEYERRTQRGKIGRFSGLKECQQQPVGSVTFHCGPCNHRGIRPPTSNATHETRVFSACVMSVRYKCVALIANAQTSLRRGERRGGGGKGRERLPRIGRPMRDRTIRKVCGQRRNLCWNRIPEQLDCGCR